MADALPVTITTPAAAATNPDLSYKGRIRFRSMTQAQLEVYPLDVGRPGFATDTFVLMIGSKAGNVVFVPYDPAPMLARVIALEAQASQQSAQIAQQSAQITSLLAQVTSSLAQINTLGEKVMYVRTPNAIPHIIQDYIDASGLSGHQPIAASNVILPPTPGIDTTLVTLTPTAATQTATLPSAASVVAASPSGVGVVQVKTLGTFPYAGVLPNGSDTIDANNATFAPTNGALNPGGLITFTTNGTTGWIVG